MNEQGKTEEETLLELEAKADAVRRAIAQRMAEAKPRAITQVLDLIATYKLTRKDVESPTWRKREFKARGPRKPKLVNTATAPTANIATAKAA